MKKHGFTLIELLIVVAIIAILAAIAVPNFLEAQVRSKISATKADMRSVALAVESYNLDHDSYPFYPDDEDSRLTSTGYMRSNDDATVNLWKGYTPWTLTTPVAYMTSLPRDTFAQGAKGYDQSAPQNFNVGDYPYLLNPLKLYHYEHHKSLAGNYRENAPEQVKYAFVGVGPDLYTPLSSTGFHNNIWELLSERPGAAGNGAFYSPTNGTVSGGDIIYHGPGIGFERSIKRVRIVN